MQDCSQPLSKMPTANYLYPGTALGYGCAYGTWRGFGDRTRTMPAAFGGYSETKPTLKLLTLPHVLQGAFNGSMATLIMTHRLI